MKSEYDLYSAVTFLLVGLGIGSVLAIVFNPKQQRVAPEEINSWRTAGLQPQTAGLQPQKEAKERAARRTAGGPGAGDPTTTLSAV